MGEERDLGPADADLGRLPAYGVRGRHGAPTVVLIDVRAPARTARPAPSWQRARRGSSPSGAEPGTRLSARQLSRARVAKVASQWSVVKSPETAAGRACSRWTAAVSRSRG